MARKIRPPAELKPRDGDEELTVEQLKQIALFKDVNLERLELEGFPGTVVLRRFAKGEVICRQDDPGYTAFYILTNKDLVELRESQLKARGAEEDAARQRLTQELSALKDAANLEPLPAAKVVKEASANKSRGLLRWLRRGKPPDDAPRATMSDGELFGEMSCLYRMPRTATVVADRDCAMLELLRNILDKMYGNKKFKEQVDTAYRRRRLGLDLRNLPVFQALDAKTLEALRERAQLEEFEPGDLICDEHERSDTMYIIRSGFVKVMKDASALLSDAAICAWTVLGKALVAGGLGADGPRRKIWNLLPAGPVRVALGQAAAGKTLAPDDKKQVLFALNELVKQPKLYAQAECKTLPEAAALESQAKFAASPAKWSQHQAIRQFNRRLLALLYPGAIFPLHAGAPRILAYRSANDPLIGEIGLVLDGPRSATCVAYDHYGEGKLINGRVELVAINRALFDEIRQSSPQAQETIRQGVEQRLRYTKQRLSLPVWHEAPAALSDQFNDLGLIQGQKLMLIDLDRCTRCDKCVEACVATHSRPWWGALPLLKNLVRGPTDGRSRLFLEGPRFQISVDGQPKNYLVPSTCRMCQDPVCLVGCPVGSIHKGENGQIVIENWCIGCSRCSTQCPYGSIQMHAVGILPRGVHGWRGRRAGGAWFAEKTPVLNTREFRERYPGNDSVRFRYVLTLTAEALRKSKSFQLHLQTATADPRVRLNGRKVVLTAVKGGATGGMKWSHEALLAAKGTPPPQGLAPGEAAPQALLSEGRNTVTVRVKPNVADDEVLFDLGLYGVFPPVVAAGISGEFNQDVVMNTAVVCDMCSEQFGQRPACVNACPHDAAMRVEATSFFPIHG